MRPLSCVLVGAGLLGSLAATGAVAQPVPVAQVPPVVRQSYQSRFPGARPVEWKRKTDRAFEAEFSFRGADVAAKFDSVGRWLETETTVLASALPAAVRTAAAWDFPVRRTIESQRLDRVSDPPLLWELHLATTGEVVKAQYRPDTRFI
jgi:hypothetical protein